jgi:hypothetical protein
MAAGHHQGRRSGINLFESNGEQSKQSTSEQHFDHYEIGQQSIFGLDVYNVFLSPTSFGLAMKLGGDRFERAKRRGMRDYLGTDSQKSHNVGAVGEVACRLLLHEPLDEIPIMDYGGADIPPDIQVRCTQSLGSAKIRPKDEDDHIVVGCRWTAKVRGQHCVVVWGAMRVGHARLHGQKSWSRDPGGIGRPAIFVPWSSLGNLTPLLEKRRGPNKKVT